jgi:hypothetical protein
MNESNRDRTRLMTSGAMATSFWWIILLLSLAAPVISALAIRAAGNTYPGRLPVSVAEWFQSLVWIGSAIVACWQLSLPTRLRAIRAVARVLILIVYLVAGLSIHVFEPRGDQPKYVGTR